MTSTQAVHIWLASTHLFKGWYLLQEAFLEPPSSVPCALQNWAPGVIVSVLSPQQKGRLFRAGADRAHCSTKSYHIEPASILRIH